MLSLSLLYLPYVKAKATIISRNIPLKNNIVWPHITTLLHPEGINIYVCTFIWWALSVNILSIQFKYVKTLALCEIKRFSFLKNFKINNLTISARSKWITEPQIIIIRRLNYRKQHTTTVLFISKEKWWHFKGAWVSKKLLTEFPKTLIEVLLWLV